MTATIEEPKTTSLYYREGSSDKEYHVRLEPKHDGFVVNIAYGRRGSTLSTGTKTSAPVDYDAALITFDKLVKEKKAKGYTEGAEGTLLPIDAEGNLPEGGWDTLNAADAIVFGKPFIANPDLGQRLREDAAWNALDVKTLYGGGAAGYTDYPTLSSAA